MQKSKQLARAKSIAKSLGFKVAARYMALRGYSFECALYVLLGVAPREMVK